jgi:hypothetical protein
MNLVFVPTSFGELIDKITILRIKSERIENGEKLQNILNELKLLEEIRVESIPSSIEIQDEFVQLKKTNETLWDIEDHIRAKESRKEFDGEFIQLARSVYIENDRRAAIKRRINQKLGSSILEEKSYTDYRIT